MDCTGTCPWDDLFGAVGGIWDIVSGFFNSIITFLGIVFGPLFLIFY